MTCQFHKSYICIYIYDRGSLGPKTSLTLLLYIKVPVSSQESEWSCICVLGYRICL